MLAPIQHEGNGAEFQIANSAEFAIDIPVLSDARNAFLGRSSSPPTVLLVAENENERRTIASLLRREGCRNITVSSALEALEILPSCRPDLIVLDRDLQQLDGLDCCRRMKAARHSQLIPILMVASTRNVEDEIAGIHAGADDYLVKPLHPDVFRARTRALIRHKIAIDRLEESETILFALAQAVEKRDQSTAGHCQRLALFSVAFGMRLGLPQSDLIALHRGGYLHDIGKICIPDAILFKPGKLTPEEWILMKTHSVRGEEICRPLRSLEHVLPIIRHHHERWDGGGYPDGIKGRNIPLLARILQLTDIYDALTTERPYKPGYSTADALEMLMAECDLGWRDPDLAKQFTALPFQELHQLADQISAVEQIEDFEASVRNLQQHLRSIAG